MSFYSFRIFQKSGLGRSPWLGIVLVWIIGILIGNRLPFGWWLWLALAVVAIILSWLMDHRQVVSYRYKSLISIIGLLIACFALSASWFQWDQHCQKRQICHSIDQVQVHQYQDVVVVGRIVSWPRLHHGRRASGVSFSMAVEWIQQSGRMIAIEDKVLIRLPADPGLRRGQRIRLKGRLVRPWSRFSSDPTAIKRYYWTHHLEWMVQVYQKHQMPQLWSVCRLGNAYCFDEDDTLARFWRKLGQLRQKLFMAWNVPRLSKEGGLMKAILWGDRSEIPRHVRLLLHATGSGHLLALSGLHVGVIVMTFWGLLMCLPASIKWRRWLVLPALVLFVLLSQGRASVLRASIMAGGWMIAFIQRRMWSSLQALSLCAWALLVINPRLIWETGFQLSFTTVATMIVLAPFFYGVFKMNMNRIGFKLVFGKICIEFLAGSLAVTISAFIGSAGLMLYHFGVITPAALWTNILLIPLVGALISLAFFYNVVFVVFGQSFDFITSVLKVLIGLWLSITAFLAHHSWGPYYYPVGRLDWVLIYYFCCFVGCVVVVRHNRVHEEIASLRYGL